MVDKTRQNALFANKQRLAMFKITSLLLLNALQAVYTLSTKSLTITLCPPCPLVAD